MSGAAVAAAVAAALAVAACVAPVPPAPRPRPARRCRSDDSRAAGRMVWPRLLVAVGAGVACTALVGHRLTPLAGPVTVAAAWHLAGRLEGAAVRRRRERLAADLPHVVDLLSACLAVGLAPSEAVRRIASAVGGPTAEELGALLARLDFGVDPVAAWRDLGRHPQLGPLGRCVARSVDSGASVADATSRLADDLRRDVRAQVEARARQVGVRAAVPLGVCLLPAFLLVGVVPLVVGSVPLVLGR